MSKRSAKPASAPTPAEKESWAIIAGRICLVVVHLVCPLLFFTNLTRNPYYTQIALLNIFIAGGLMFWAAECWRVHEFRWPRLPFDIPLVVFLGVALISTLLAWTGHPLLRPGLGYEGLRVWVFTLINCVAALYLPFFFTKPSEKDQTPSIWPDLFFSAVWGLAWFGFHSFRPDPRNLMWDPYGGLLWGLALFYAYQRIKTGGADRIFHVVFAVTVVSGGYSLVQYLGRDMIWSSVIQPYGGRPVSSFGNPNFLSSYMMLAAIVALAYAFRSKRSEAWGYLIVAIVGSMSVLVTLTRSSYVGLFAGFALLAVFLINRENTVWLKRSLIAVAAFVALILIFPHTPLSQIQSPLARFTEVFQAMKTGESYGPWHQRLLIWSSAWDMLKERPFFGKGWGAFELFYPFYQGKYLLTQEFWIWRTHANNAHNVLMEMMSQTGFAGTGAALWLMATIGAGGWFIVRRAKEVSVKILTAGLLASLGAMIVDNFFGNVSIFFAVPAFLFWWNVGALYHRSDGPVWTVRPVKALEHLALIFMVIFSAGVCVYFFNRWQQEKYYFKGFKEAKSNQVVDSYKSLEKAYNWFAGEVNGNYELGNSYARHAKDLQGRNLIEESQRFNQKAVGAYEAALRANPGYDEIYFNLGLTYLQAGKNDEGVRLLENAVFINPLLRDAYAALGGQYLGKRETERAQRLFEQGVEAFPQDKDMWNNLGYTYTQLGEDLKSRDCYRRALQLDPAFEQAWHNLNVVCQKLKVSDPLLNAPRVFHEMQSALKEKNFPAAKRAAAQLVDLSPQNADIRLSYANILFYLQEMEASIAEFKTAIALKPRFLVAHVNLARVYHFLKKDDLAREHVAIARSIDPDHADVKQAAAEVLQ